jgi:Na+/melibiose symporter-like transporter
MLGSMLGDITDQDELEHGKRREGIIFGAESFAWKALTGLGPLAAGLIIDAVGLSDKVAPEDVQEGVVTSLGLAQGGIMVVFFALSIFFLSRHDLPRSRHEAIIAELESRKTAS